MCSREAAAPTGALIPRGTANPGQVRRPAITGARHKPGAPYNPEALRPAGTVQPLPPGAAVPTRGRTVPAVAAALTADRAVHTAHPLRVAAAAHTGRVRRAAAAAPTGRVHQAAAVLLFAAVDPPGAAQVHPGEAAVVPGHQDLDDNCQKQPGSTGILVFSSLKFNCYETETIYRLATAMCFSDSRGPK